MYIFFRKLHRNSRDSRWHRILVAVKVMVSTQKPRIGGRERKDTVKAYYLKIFDHYSEEVLG